MKNAELSQLFAELAELLEYQGENPFKLNAYRKASRVLADLTEDVEVLARENRLKDLDGIGDAISKKILEYLNTGKVTRYEEARSAVPPGVLDMLRVPGLGPKTVALLVRSLGLATLDDLGAAARAGRLRDLPGMGVKKEENILRGMEMLAQSGQRMRLGEALPLVENLTGAMRSAGVDRVVYAGSLRRMKETVGDLDLLAAGKDGAAITARFCRLSEVSEVLAEGATKASIRTREGRQVDLRVVDPVSFGAALQYFTGSKAHNIRLRELAREKKLKVNEYGVFKGEKRVAGDTEESVYEALGLPWIPPELREDRGEIDAALAGTLPNLIEPDGIRGDLHVHTTWSDGLADIAAMAEAARARGYAYLAISDHTRALKVFGGLSEDRLLEQIRAVGALNRRRSGIRVLAGVEVDIKSDGTLDLPDRVLAELDFVTASVHSGFKQSRERMTQRIVRALANPHVNALGHPTGRLIGQREPYDVDLDAVIRAAAANGKALEVNAQPDRLDLSDAVCRRARDLGATVVINTDAHSPEQLGYMRLGVATARRGWIEAGNVLNALPLDALLKRLHSPRFHAS